jgi:hypothetical protein
MIHDTNKIIIIVTAVIIMMAVHSTVGQNFYRFHQHVDMGV